MELEHYDDALAALNTAIEMPVEDGVNEAFLLRNRGVVKQRIGKNGFIKDLKDASDMGDTLAGTILKNRNKSRTKAKPKAKAKVKAK